MHQLIFAGFGSGEVDFQHLLDTTSQDDLEALNELINRIVTQLINQDPEVKIIVLTVGLSDRNDDPDLSCNARRNSERDASRKRMQSVDKWIGAQIKERALQNDVDSTTADRSWLTAFGISALTAYLEHPNPDTEAERSENRQVLIYFKEYPLSPEEAGTIAYGEEENDEEWIVFA